MNSHDEYGQAQLECCAEDAECQVETAVCCGCKGKLLRRKFGKNSWPSMDQAYGGKVRVATGGEMRLASNDANNRSIVQGLCFLKIHLKKV